jgi:hypothetical protein
VVVNYGVLGNALEQWEMEQLSIATEIMLKIRKTGKKEKVSVHNFM